MAHYRDNFTTTLMQKIDGELICGVCLEFFTTPILLPCGHNFCKACILSIVQTGRFNYLSLGPSNSFNCPVCQARTSNSPGHLDHLPINRALESIAQLYKESSPVDIFDSAWQADLALKPGQCEDHKLPCDQFCDSCIEVACRMCVKAKHSARAGKHRVEPLASVTHSYQLEICETLSELKKKLLVINDKMGVLEEVISGIQANEEQMCKQLGDSVATMVAKLKSHQTQLENEVRRSSEDLQRPVHAELTKCRGLKTHTSQLMKKLSDIRRDRHRKDVAFTLQLMRTTCQELNTFSYQDIDWYLRNEAIPEVNVPMWDIDLRGLTAAIDQLTWKDRYSGTYGKDMHDVSTQTVASNNPTLNVSYHVTPPHPNSADVTKAPEQVWDEIDGDFVPRASRMSEQPETQLGKKTGKNRDSVSPKVSARKKDLRNRTHSNDSELHERSRKKSKERKKERCDSGQTEAFSRSSSTTSLPVAEGLRVPVHSGLEHKINLDEEVLSKSLDAGGFHETPKSSNAEALAKFLARRKTLSPSASSPVFTSSMSDRSISSPSIAECDTGRDNELATGVDWRIDPAEELVQAKKSVTKHNSDGQLRSSKATSSEVISKETSSAGLNMSNDMIGESLVARVEKHNHAKNTGAQRTFTVIKPDTNNTDSREKHSESSCNESLLVASATPDHTGDDQTQIKTKHSPKEFTKKPLASSMDFDFSPSTPVESGDQKFPVHIVTQV
ncbi:uncharacterized protein LOC128227509 [Mya arenaria]|uniref:uncharacterized protein LOC128227509 n=1 Tax=Mya arenaria TaxID=6604 RepID=UPI0022E5FE34|nr:uncharacterized protein LOC128227509 [Mya arenaria]XP_052794087.1 uncharacterized protein LOC128227509 [Mya arenaria]